LKVELIFEFSNIETQSQLFSLGMSVGRIIRELEITTRTRFTVKFNVFWDAENTHKNHNGRSDSGDMDFPEIR